MKTLFSLALAVSLSAVLLAVSALAQQKDGDKLAVTDTTVHKIDGKARYNYEEKNGVWERVTEKS